MYLITKCNCLEVHSIDNMANLCVNEDRVTWKDQEFQDVVYASEYVIGFFDDRSAVDYLNSAIKKREFSDDWAKRVNKIMMEE